MPDPINPETVAAPASTAVADAPPAPESPAHEPDAVEEAEKASVDLEARREKEREKQIAILKDLDKKMGGVDSPAAEQKEAVEKRPDAAESAPAAVEKKPESTAQDDDYDGIGPKQLQHLKQAQSLPSAADWKKLSLDERRSLLTSAREKISNNTREFQRQQREAERPPAPERETPSRAAPAQEQAKPDEWLTQLEGQFGPESAKLIDKRLKEIEQKSVNETKTLREKLDAIEAERQANQQAKYRSEAREARKELSSELKGLDVDDDMHVGLWNAARVQFAARLQSGQKPTDISFKDCYIDAAHLKYREDFTLAAQRKLAQSSKTAMAGSPVPAGKVSGPGATMSAMDIQVARLRALNEGKSVEEARLIGRSE